MLPYESDPDFKALFDAVFGEPMKREKGTQMIAVLSAKGKLYWFENHIDTDEHEARFLALLAANDDTQISKILCAWETGEVDLPSYRFRKALCGFNQKNMDATILLRAAEGYNVRTISATF